MTVKQMRRLSQMMVLSLSVVLIAYISAATFRGESFVDEPGYMQFQLFVCMAFMFDFFFNLWLEPRGRRRRQFFKRIFFLLISVPYLNIIAALDLAVSAHAMEYLKYIPLIRGAYVMVVLINYVSTSRIMGVFMSYLSIVVLMLYFSSMLFYVREHPVNGDVGSYATALWWSALQFTTIGAPIDPVTPTGKVLAALLAAMGVVMFPLFTVYLTEMLRKYFARS